jgi:hypothetical protein
MTDQEIFDRVVAHFIKQGHRSVTVDQHAPGGAVPDCMYRAPNGDMCAIGCLIKDEAYTPELETMPAFAESVHHALEASGITVEGRAKLFDQLQYAHDYSDDAEGLRERLVTLAYEFGLDYSNVTGITNWE